MRVYTAIYGGYDEPKPTLEHPKVEEWVCFTDDPDLDAPGWRVVWEEARYPHPRLAAKWRKCHPPEGDTLWVDGSVWVTSPEFLDAVAYGIDDSRMTLFAHPWRDCIYDEVQASVGMLKYAGFEDAMRRQVNHYAAQGWPAHGGLYASTVIGRRGFDHQLLQMGAAWFAHCEAWSYQDQLSLPYLLDRYRISPAPLPYSLTENPWFSWCGHTRDD